MFAVNTVVEVFSSAVCGLLFFLAKYDFVLFEINDHNAHFYVFMYFIYVVISELLKIMFSSQYETNSACFFLWVLLHYLITCLGIELSSSV